MSEFYILDENKKPIPATIEEWGKMFEDPARKQVACSKSDRGILVSTVFLGMDHGFGESPPILFETMIFGGEHDEDQWRYATWDEAVAGHKAACTLAGISEEAQ